MAVDGDQARFLRCIGEPTRLQIIKLLAGEERCVSEIAVALDKEQPLVSHHLRVMKECNIVKERQEAQKVYYGLTGDRLAKLIYDIEALMVELSLCKCQEVNCEDRESQRCCKEEILRDS